MNSLYQRALAFENDVEDCLVDERGLVRSALHIDTMQPFEKNFFAGKHVLRYAGETWTDFGDFMHYENVGMCSGAYLAAMVWKYRVTRAAKDLEKARRTVRAIRRLFDQSQQIEEGFYCKCYGTQLSDQLSSDQYIYTMMGLDTFLEFADASEHESILKMIEKMVLWWMRRDYTYPYFGKALRWPLARFPAFAWLAYHHTGRTEFRAEFERLLEMPAVRRELPFMTMDWNSMIEDARTREPAFPFEQNSNLRVIRVSAECTQSGTMSTEALLNYEAPERELWLHKLRLLYETGRHGIGSDGYALGPRLLNKDTGEIMEIRELLCNGEHKDGWRFPAFVGWIRSGMWSAMFARAAVAIHRFFPEMDCLETARNILAQLDQPKLRWFVDMDGRQFPADMQWMDRVYSGDAVTHWLWAYWEAASRYASEL